MPHDYNLILIIEGCKGGEPGSQRELYETFYNYALKIGADIVIIEGLNMAAIDPGSYEMFALPLKLTGADGAPARVIVRRVAND